MPISDVHFKIITEALDYPEDFDDDWDTRQKGVWAVNLCIWLMKQGRFPFVINAKQTDDIELDIQGTDIFINAKIKIQVKCDALIEKTGNLYIQTHEINPFNYH